MEKPGLSRSKTTGYTAASYSRPIRSATTQPTASAKPLPTVPAKTTVQRSNTTTGNLGAAPGSSHTNVRYYKPTTTGPAVPSKDAPRGPSVPLKSQPSISRAPPSSSRQPATTTVKRSNTTPIRSATAPANNTKPPVTYRTGALGHSGSLKRDTTPIPQARPGAGPQPPPKAGPLLRSKSESQRPGQTFANKADAVKALKAPLPAIPQGAVAKNLVLAAEDNARVLDSGLPSVTSSHIVRVAESNGECLKEAERALYGRHAPPDQRIIWNRTSDSDRGMKSLLDWVDKVRWGLASLGLHKFLATKQRGALIFNINGRLSNSPETPAVDWITFEDAQRTLDGQIQSFIATYDPATHVLVFTFRVMPGGDKLHIWGKKLAIPQSLPMTYAAELKETVKKMNKKKLDIVSEDRAPKRSLSFTKWIKRKLSSRSAPN